MPPFPMLSAAMRRLRYFFTFAAISFVLFTREANSRNCSARNRDKIIIKKPAIGPIRITIIPGGIKPMPIALKR
jgi:hypothetical protein